MKRKLISLGFILLLTPLALLSQEKAWTLEECIAIALQNNIRIKQQEIMNRIPGCCPGTVKTERASHA